MYCFAVLTRPQYVIEFVSRREIHGKGDYFSTDIKCAISYATSPKHLILAQIIKATGYVKVVGDYYIVDNPTDRSFTLCLPIVVVCCATDTQSKLSWIIGDQRPIPSFKVLSCKVPLFQWYWTNDGPKLEPYSNSVNVFLEKCYQSFLRGEGSSEVDTLPIIRYKDSVPQVYHINFKNNTQKNVGTGYIREIVRKKSPTSTIWVFLDDDGNWTPYDDEANEMVEAAYQKYVNEDGSSAIDVQGSKNDFRYRVDFDAMNQKNLSFKTTRKIKRKVISNAVWKFLSEDNIWIPYDKQAQVTVELSYQKYLSKGHPSSITIRFAECGGKYRVDFKVYKQINVRTAFERKIMRAEDDDLGKDAPAVATAAVGTPASPATNSWCTVM